MMGSVAKVAFIVLRVLTGAAALVALGITAIVIFAIGAFHWLQGAMGAIAAVVVTFVSAFRKSPTTPPPDLNIPLPLFGLAAFFLAMFVSVFLPDQKVYLHVVAGMAVVAEGWEIWRFVHDPTAQPIYWPVILIWAIFYVVCLRR